MFFFDKFGFLKSIFCQIRCGIPWKHVFGDELWQSHANFLVDIIDAESLE